MSEYDKHHEGSHILLLAKGSNARLYLEDKCCATIEKVQLMKENHYSHKRTHGQEYKLTLAKELRL